VEGTYILSNVRRVRQDTKKVRERGVLTLWSAQGERKVRVQSEIEKLSRTHFLMIMNDGSNQVPETMRAGDGYLLSEEHKRQDKSRDRNQANAGHLLPGDRRRRHVSVHRRRASELEH
jgi:hypothetical protein